MRKITRNLSFLLALLLCLSLAAPALASDELEDVTDIAAEAFADAADEPRAEAVDEDEAEIADVTDEAAEDILDIEAETVLVDVRDEPVTDGATYSGVCGENVTWTLDTSTGELTISGTGAMTEYSYYSSIPWYSYRTSVKTVSIRSGVTTICDRAFYNCANLTSVTIPDSVTTIGSYAFYYCTSLTSVTIPDGVTSIGSYAFRSCTSLTSVTIGKGVTSIGDYAFNYCTGLTSVTIPDSVTSIGSYAFQSCTNLETVILPESLTDIDATAFLGTKWFTNGGQEILNERQTFRDTVTLYALSDAYDSALSIPDSEPQSYRIDLAADGLGSDAAFSVIYGNSVTVSDAGLIEPATQVWYWSGGVGYPRPIENPSRIEVTYKWGTSIVRAKTDTATYYYLVTVEDYADYYADQVMREFVREHITSGMTDLEKLQAIASFPAQYDYSASYSTATAMIIMGGGDCWASSYAILAMCDMVGLQAHLRYGANDSLAGSGHRNVAVKLGDSVYIAEAGYSGTAPRAYRVYQEEGGFYTRLSNGTLTIVQYDGFDSDVTIPSTINGYTVTAIGNYAFYFGSTYSEQPVTGVTLPDTLQSIGKYAFYETQVSRIVIPDSVTYIGDSAFYGAEALETVIMPDTITGIGASAFRDCPRLTAIELPASVNEIGDYAFSECTSLRELSADGNQAFVTVDNVLFDSSMTKLITYPAGLTAEAYTIPSSVLEIGGGAFMGNGALQNLDVPESVTQIGDYAFARCSSLRYVSGMQGVAELGTYVFYYDTSLSVIHLPPELTSVPTAVLGDCSALQAVGIGTAVTEIGQYAFRNCRSLTSVVIPASVTTIGAYAFYSCASLTDVYYAGSETDWAAISIGDNNTPLTSAAIHYNFTPITPSFSWSDDLSAATVTYTGTNGGSMTADADVTVVLSSTAYDGVVTAVSYTDSSGNATNKVTYTAAVTIDGVPYTDTIEEYGLFAGWYKDSACTEAYTSQPGANDVKYAKLVDPAVLTVKYQLKNPTYSTDTTSRMRIVTTVDSLVYSSVGFIMSYIRPSTGTSTTRTLSTNRVYSKITGSGSIDSFNYKPTVFSTSSAYFCAYSMDLPAALFNTALHIQPMWTTADGTVVYGTARDITASGSASFVKA